MAQSSSKTQHSVAFEALARSLRHHGMTMLASLLESSTRNAVGNMRSSTGLVIWCLRTSPEQYVHTFSFRVNTAERLAGFQVHSRLRPWEQSSGHRHPHTDRPTYCCRWARSQACRHSGASWRWALSRGWEDPINICIPRKNESCVERVHCDRNCEDDTSPDSDEEEVKIIGGLELTVHLMVPLLGSNPS